MSLELIELIHRHSRPLAPIPAGAAPDLRSIPGIRAVLFDVYGTLFISGSGDIGQASAHDGESEIRLALTANHCQVRSAEHHFQKHFLTLISDERTRMQTGGIAHPEIEIREIWAQFLKECAEQQTLAVDSATIDIEKLAIDYECRINPVWPMPGAERCIAECAGRELALGIVSNAQFFTPLLFDSLLGKSHVDLGFRPELCAWSYRARRGKPDPELFHPPLRELQSRGVAPEETLFVGNDMLNDAWAAHQCGMRTILFAGDQRSLRMREGDPRCATMPVPQALTRMNQLPGLLTT